MGLPPMNRYTPPFHWFYGGGSDADIARGIAKLGETSDPYHRLSPYGTAMHRDNPFRFRILIGIPVCDIRLIHDIESGWLSKFVRVESLEEDLEDLNKAATVEGIHFNEHSDFFICFKQVLADLNLSALGITVCQTNEEINRVLREYRDKNIRINRKTLFEKFIAIFLPGKIPRRIQTELWDRFQTICNNPAKLIYRGIVQWPTGVGKTIATLMLIVISAERAKSRGEMYRGLFVSPKNDILDTISRDFNKLSEFGIRFYDGSHAEMSSLTLPTDCHILVSACQASLITEKGMCALPSMSHVHYDEVHRITGELYFKILKDMLVKWETEIVTGTSATPFTCSSSQRDKISELFGNPLNLLHKCDVDEAVREGWIAKPRFIVNVIKRDPENRSAELDSYLKSISAAIQKKKALNLWRGGKVISFTMDTIDDVLYCMEHAHEFIQDASIYSAGGEERTDTEFIDAPADGNVRILFACQRYREGSDIYGLEMTCSLVGNTSAAYIMLQICGRALRIDYPEKEGWCVIVRPSAEGTTDEDVLASLIFEINDFLGKADGKYKPREVERIIRTYLGEVSVEGHSLTIDETIKRVQAVYIRKEYARRTPKEKYSLVREHNREMGLVSKDDYHAHAAEHPIYISDPKAYFEGCWDSWYHFLGVDTSNFPHTKAEWIHMCKDMGFWKKGWSDARYLEKRGVNMPEDPKQLYEDYTNWDKEMEVEEEMVWS